MKSESVEAVQNQDQATHLRPADSPPPRRGRPSLSAKTRVSPHKDSVHIFLQDEAYVLKEIRQRGPGTSRAFVLRGLIRDGINWREQRETTKATLTRAGRDATETGVQNVLNRDLKPVLEALHERLNTLPTTARQSADEPDQAALLALLQRIETALDRQPLSQPAPLILPSDTARLMQQLALDATANKLKLEALESQLRAFFTFLISTLAMFIWKLFPTSDQPRFPSKEEWLNDQKALREGFEKAKKMTAAKP